MKIIAILVNNAFKTVQQRAKDKEDICRRADARQRYYPGFSETKHLLLYHEIPDMVFYGYLYASSSFGRRFLILLKLIVSVDML